MAKAKITLEIAIDSDLGLFTQEARTTLDGKVVYENERGVTYENLSEMEAQHHYSLLMKYKDADEHKSKPAYYGKAIPLAYFHDLLMKALEPLAKDERFLPKPKDE